MKPPKQYENLKRSKKGIACSTVCKKPCKPWNLKNKKKQTNKKQMFVYIKLFTWFFFGKHNRFSETDLKPM